MRIKILLCVCCFGFVVGGAASAQSLMQKPLMTTDIIGLASGDFLLSHKGTQQVQLVTKDFRTIKHSWSFSQIPTGLSASSTYYYVTAFTDKGELYRINTATAQIEGCLRVGSGANTPLLHPNGNKLYVCNQFSNSVMEVDLNTFTVSRTVSVLREPKAAVISPDGRYLFVANFLPNQRADVDDVAACVSVIDLSKFKKIKDIRLVNGSNALRGIALSPDARYVLVTHNLGHFQVPTTQLQQGWMNTSAMSLIEVASLQCVGTVLLDDPERGAAGIYGISSTVSQIIVGHSGTHEVSLINYQPFIKKFEQCTHKEKLNYDLTFLSGLRRRIPLVGNAPHRFAVVGQKAYIPTYFSDTLNILNVSSAKIEETIALQPNRVERTAFRGEKYFNDASYCFQNWQSCNGCHPGDARTDAMNWDLLNDGIGNPKNCKSMLYTHVTPPSMISGIRTTAELAVRKGYSFIQFSQIPEEYAACVDDYLRELRPVMSPYRIDGELSEKALKGRNVFEQLKCGECHSGPYFTDLKMYRIGKNIEFEKGWDTPTLIEVWRTAPYLFDGRAATLEEVFQTEKHGIDRKVSKREIEELVEYIKSL